MDRRDFLPALVVVASGFGAPAKSSILGKLIQASGEKPALEVPPGKRIRLEGDEPTSGVLADARLSGMELELIGKFSAPSLFTVDPIHTRAMFVHKNGKRYLITYWCELCSIRTYTPGRCWCCQQETQLDLRESDKP